MKKSLQLVYWVLNVILFSALYNWESVRSACQKIKPYALQNVTVTTLRNDTALVEYDLPLDEWEKDKGSYPVDSIEVKVFSWNEKKTVYKEKILRDVTSHNITGLRPFDTLQYIVRAVSKTLEGSERRGCKHSALNFTLLPPIDGVWSNWTVVKECRASISCDEYRNGSLVLDHRRISTRFCIPPRYHGKPCAGEGERNETCSLLSIPTCNETQNVAGTGINDQEKIQTPPPSAPSSSQSSALWIALSVTLPACVTITVVFLLYKYIQARNYPPAISTSQPRTFALDNFSVNISEAGNGTYLDWYMSCGDLAPVDETPAVYICYGHNLPTPKFDEHYQQVQQLVSALRNDGISVIFPDTDVHSLMQNIEEWFETKQLSLQKIIVLCSKDLVRLWKDATRTKCFETASARLAYREYNCIKDAIQQGNIDIQPVVLGSTRADTDTTAIVPALLRDKNLKPLILDNPADDRRFREWMRACCDDDVSGGCSDDSHQHTPPIHRSLSESSASKLAGMECSQEALPSLPSRDCTCSIRSTFEVSSRSLGQNMPPRSKELEESNSTQPCDEQPPVTSHLCTATDEKTSIRQECHDVPLYLVEGGLVTASVEDLRNSQEATMSTFSLQGTSQEEPGRSFYRESDDSEYQQMASTIDSPGHLDVMPVCQGNATLGDSAYETNCPDVKELYLDLQTKTLREILAASIPESPPVATEAVGMGEVLPSAVVQVDSGDALQMEMPPPNERPAQRTESVGECAPEEELATAMSIGRVESNKTSLNSDKCASVSLTSQSPEPRLEEAVAFGPVTTQFLHVSNSHPHTVGNCPNPLALRGLRLNTPGMLQPMLQQISMQQAHQSNETPQQAHRCEPPQQVTSNSSVSPIQPTKQPGHTPAADQPFLSWLRKEL